jgi:hypothetical protein
MPFYLKILLFSFQKLKNMRIMKKAQILEKQETEIIKNQFLT